MSTLFCTSFCEHGGQCQLPPGHPGTRHDSGYCQWDDARSLTREEANAVLRGKPGGAEQLMMEDFFLPLFDDYEEGDD